jgi:hypothetical protein
LTSNGVVEVKRGASPGEQVLSCTNRYSTRKPRIVALLCPARHDVSHLHRLTWLQLLNDEHDLVIRCVGRALEQFPKALQQLAFIPAIGKSG